MNICHRMLDQKSLSPENLFRCLTVLKRLRVFAIIVTTLGVAAAANASPESVESSHPPFLARVDGNKLLSLVVEPRQLSLDMNRENSIRSETNDFKPARYYFSDATVPRSVLKNLKEVYRYNRRRDVPIVSSGGNWVIAEYFRANSHIPSVRFRLLGKRVQRQEQLDPAGKVTGIVLVGWAPRSSIEDDVQSGSPSAPGEHAAWIRVLKVSATGKKTLVAVAWKASGGAVPASMNDEPNERDLNFGRPDGTVLWHSMDEFVKSTGIDLNARSLSGKSPQ